MATHRIFITFVTLFCCFCLPHLIEAEQVFVDQSGNGNFTTIQKAIDSVPANNRNWFFINVAAGLYKEKVKIPRDKPFIVLVGAGTSKTRVEWDDHVSIQTPTFALSANNTVVKSLTFVNTYNLPNNGKVNKNDITPAPAAMIEGDKCAFYSVGFAGIQDTLWDKNGRHFFHRCTIQGAVDFIFGSGQSIYKNCDIQVLGEALEPGAGYITAQARTSPDDADGFVFMDSLVHGTGKAYLGRAYRNYSRVIFCDTNLTNVVVPKGWWEWKFVGNESRLTYAEVRCFGSGSSTTERVRWVKKPSDPIVQRLCSLDFINNGGWVQNLPIRG
ncbi:hypothetical protein BRARA_B00879 [Brassica rapa]|uniref:Pectinesterase n=2 Tax=Brassica campestris TaxID=3711 RepID=A0A398A7I5_BRACM|nr:hypothetical protein BRARA_B00879 [Brassica rapa]VDC85942.1 unnamed protein product [Brassica rapa]